MAVTGEEAVAAAALADSLAQQVAAAKTLPVEQLQGEVNALKSVSRAASWPAGLQLPLRPYAPNQSLGLLWVGIACCGQHPGCIASQLGQIGAVKASLTVLRLCIGSFCMGSWRRPCAALCLPPPEACTALLLKWCDLAGWELFAPLTPLACLPLSTLPCLVHMAS